MTDGNKSDENKECKDTLAVPHPTTDGESEEEEG
jgi:hypothetical protein